MRVNRLFGPTSQGEGRSAGMPTMFLRLWGCNLACGYCDTPETWNMEGTPFVHPEKFDPQKEIHEISCDQIVALLKEKGPNVKNLVISGGEPMLQQGEIISLLNMLKKDDYWVEIETNGTIAPSDWFLELIDQINCSPKTSNSGSDNTLTMMERPSALKKYAASRKTNFKFVVEDRNDLPEIKELINRYGMRNVSLMAKGRTREEQYALAPLVMNMCQENGYNFSPRLQILYSFD